MAATPKSRRPSSGSSAQQLAPFDRAKAPIAQTSLSTMCFPMEAEAVCRDKEMVGSGEQRSKRRRLQHGRGHRRDVGATFRRLHVGAPTPEWGKEDLAYKYKGREILRRLTVQKPTPKVASTTRACLTQTGAGWYLPPLVWVFARPRIAHWRQNQFPN